MSQRRGHRRDPAARHVLPDYGDPYRARDGYAKLGARQADACATCIDTPCASACVEGVNVANLLRTADKRLAWV